MSAMTAYIQGIGFWGNQLPDWEKAAHFARTGELPDAESIAKKPAPQLLAANERRRAPDSVLLALDVGLQACATAKRDPSTLPSIFTSTHGDLAITDYMAETLATDPVSISPTKFHNSVHNAAAGYWTIGNHCMAPATAISAHDYSFAQGLIEALMQLSAGNPDVLLVAYDIAATGPLATMSHSKHVLGGALLLSSRPGGIRLNVSVENIVHAADTSGPLYTRYDDNAMAPMLPVFDALALRQPVIHLPSGRQQSLHIEAYHAL